MWIEEPKKIKIKVDNQGNFTYDPSSFRLLNTCWNRLFRKDETTVVWECELPFSVDFNERSLFKRFTFSSRKREGKPRATKPAKVRRKAVPGRYKYRVFAYHKGKVIIDDCPDGGTDEDKC